MKLFVRTIGVIRARVKISMTNIAHNMLRDFWLTGKPRTASRGGGKSLNASLSYGNHHKNERPAERITLQGMHLCDHYGNPNR